MIFGKRKPKKEKKAVQKNVVAVKKKPQTMKHAPHKEPPRTTIEEKEREVKQEVKKEATHEKNVPVREDYVKDFLKTFDKLTSTHRAYEVWNDFIQMFACSISNPLDKAHFDEREDIYLQTVKKYKKQDRLLFPELAAITIMAMEENPEQDFLGSIFMSLELGNDKSGQFFTPYNICRMTSEMIIGDVKKLIDKQGYITINDPCCGGGAMLIAGIHEAKRQLEKENINFQNHVFVVGQDIDKTVALMCYIQLSLLGVAGFVKIGNSLTEPISDEDSLENYWFTPMYFSNVWATRRILKNLDDILKGDKKVKKDGRDQSV